MYKEIRLNSPVEIPDPQKGLTTIVTGLHQGEDGEVLPTGHLRYHTGGESYRKLTDVPIDEDQIRTLVRDGKGIAETVTFEGHKTTSVAIKTRNGHRYLVISSREKLT